MMTNTHFPPPTTPNIQNTIHDTIQQSFSLPQSAASSFTAIWNNIDSDFWEPIKLSTLAGLSTCIGASVAFVVDGDDDVDDVDVAVQQDDNYKSSIAKTDDKAITVTGERNRPEKNASSLVKIGPDLLAFSLALAGSVMITVCIVSIIPECLLIDIDVNRGGAGDSNVDVGAATTTTWNIFGHVVSSQMLLHRTVGFVIGWIVYALLSQLLTLLPEEDEWSNLLMGEEDDDDNINIPVLDSTNDMGIKSDMDGTTTIVNNDNNDNTHRDNNAQSTTSSSSKQSSWRLTILLFLSLLLHNFPEGLAVAFSAASSATNNQSSSSSSSSSVVRIVATTTPATTTSDAIIFDPSTVNPMISSSAVALERYTNPNELKSPLPERISSSILLSSPTIDEKFTASILQTPTISSSSSSSSSTSSSPSSLASIVTLGIALHNIPEGIAIAIPCMAARPNQPFLAFGLASLSGLAEPVGAFIGLIVLRLRSGGGVDGGLQQHNDNEIIGNGNGQDMGDALAFVAGIMLAVAICELLPEANRQRKDCDGNNSFVLGIVLGVGIMVLTELYLGG